ncbi:hypothetical protein SAMN04487977_11070 [Treponema bryantii]|uniref:Uncharacterized protein n=1 Tax=Treponema bryantii TaxID=163 RepID=A0A1H9IR65_9SPIR|nr:hypothetical protein [Treponema bryantii]SEQ76885.1 hypothetical protein SAMN04487977_11070 [Treponema bryantii]
MKIFEIIKTFAPLAVSILVVILNHFFSLSKTKKEIKNKSDIEENNKIKEKAFELISSLLALERQDYTFSSKINISLMTGYKLTPENEKELELGQREFSNELLKIRSISHFYFPEILKNCDRIEKFHDEKIKKYLSPNISINDDFFKDIDSITENIHTTALKIIKYLREKFNTKKIK